MTPPAVADQASFAHAAEFFNSLLDLIEVASIASIVLGLVVIVYLVFYTTSN